MPIIRETFEERDDRHHRERDRVEGARFTITQADFNTIIALAAALTVAVRIWTRRNYTRRPTRRPAARK